MKAELCPFMNVDLIVCRIECDACFHCVVLGCGGIFYLPRMHCSLCCFTSPMFILAAHKIQNGNLNRDTALWPAPYKLLFINSNICEQSIFVSERKYEMNNRWLSFPFILLPLISESLKQFSFSTHQKTKCFLDYSAKTTIFRIPDNWF